MVLFMRPVDGKKRWRLRQLRIGKGDDFGQDMSAFDRACAKSVHAGVFTAVVFVGEFFRWHKFAMGQRRGKLTIVVILVTFFAIGFNSSSMASVIFSFSHLIW